MCVGVLGLSTCIPNAPSIHTGRCGANLLVRDHYAAPAHGWPPTSKVGVGICRCAHTVRGEGQCAAGHVGVAAGAIGQDTKGAFTTAGVICLGDLGRGATACRARGGGLGPMHLTSMTSQGMREQLQCRASLTSTWLVLASRFGHWLGCRAPAMQRRTAAGG